MAAAVEKLLDTYPDGDAAWGAYARNMSEIKQQLKFADGKLVKDVVDEVTTLRYEHKHARTHGLID